MGNDDHYNLMSCLIARQRGARKTIMTTQEVDYMSAISSIGIDVIVNARMQTASEILRYVRGRRTMSVVKFGQDQAEAIEFAADAGSDLVGTPLQKLDLPRGAIIGAVVRHQEVILPTGGTVIHPDDIVVAFVLTQAMEDFEPFIAGNSG
jgi:trk system potassium uptake protein TrkA